MAINLEKSVQQVKVVLDKIGFDQKVNVVLALDISYSMTGSFSSGKVQELVERLLAIGINMDINKEIDVYLFGERAHHAAKAYRENIDSFVNCKIMNRFSLEGSTLYAPVMKKIANDFGYKKRGIVQQQGNFLGKLFNALTGNATQQDELTVMENPIVVFFVTDGENFDENQTESFIREISNQPIFWQFIGINGSFFPFLERLDNIDGRYIDNANFFDAGDISSISDNILYSRILKELPYWYKEAERKGVIK